MLRLFIFSLILIICSCSSHSPENGLTGLWKIHVVEQKDASDNWVTADWMKNGIGYLHYDSNKNMSLHFTPENYDKIVVPEESDKHLWDLGVLVQLASDYRYLGEYEIVSDNTVQHTRLMHANPEDNHASVQRQFAFSGDTLTLSAPEFGLRLKWLRVN